MMTKIPELFNNKAYRHQLLITYQRLIYDPRAEKHGISWTYADYISKRLEHMREGLKSTT